MTLATLAPKIPMDQVILIDPVDHTDEFIVPPLVWSSAIGNFEPDRPGHFQIQISTAIDFSAIVVDKISFINAAGFEYESAPGVWSALPSNGLAVADFGKHVRYTPSLVTHTDYYWRVRPMQQIAL